jgi:hypothetical protein
VADTFNSMGHDGCSPEGSRTQWESPGNQNKCLGGDHDRVATTEMNRGVQSHQGNNENALVHPQNALEINLQRLGPLHVRVASIYCNMGIVYEKSAFRRIREAPENVRQGARNHDKFA